MSKLISGKEAKLAWANGIKLQMTTDDIWCEIQEHLVSLDIFDSGIVKFRLKPRTIKLNIEVPAPFEPKEGEACCFISDESVDGYHTISYNSKRYSGVVFGLYRPSDIEQVVAALREVFK